MEIARAFMLEMAMTLLLESVVCFIFFFLRPVSVEQILDRAKVNCRESEFLEFLNNTTTPLQRPIIRNQFIILHFEIIPTCKLIEISKS